MNSKSNGQQSRANLKIRVSRKKLYMPKFVWPSMYYLQNNTKINGKLKDKTKLHRFILKGHKFIYYPGIIYLVCRSLF
jgi:late competence protein required for DNA uptake (superfamily II DNA/RNA helicase)